MYQVRGHRTGSGHSEAEEYPREKHKQPKVVHARHKQSKVVHAFITADAIHSSTACFRICGPFSPMATQTKCIKKMVLCRRRNIFEAFVSEFSSNCTVLHVGSVPFGAAVRRVYNIRTAH